MQKKKATRTRVLAWLLVVALMLPSLSMPVYAVEEVIPGYTEEVSDNTAEEELSTVIPEVESLSTVSNEQQESVE
ncbi:MAG: hypothetical protein IKW28_07060, partial [Lachnospiraceae bacterium]|nr:hypothetical protein [Lachnospiraceae bacterium]